MITFLPVSVLSKRAKRIKVKILEQNVKIQGGIGQYILNFFFMAKFNLSGKNLLLIHKYKKETFKNSFLKRKKSSLFVKRA